MMNIKNKKAMHVHEKEYIRKHFFSFFAKGNVLFIHGYNSTWFKHRSILDFFYENGYNVFTLDLPNHGKNTDYNSQLFFTDYCNYVLDFIKQHNLKKIVLFGHSMGGGVIGAIFKEINKITKFVILQDPLQKSVKKKDTGIIAKAFDMMKKHGIGGIKKWLTPSNNSLHSILLLNDIVSDDVLVNIENGLKMIDVPTLVFFGENDDVIDPMDAKEYFESIVNKKYLYFEIIKNAKHSPDIENFLETKEVIINFLNK